MKILRILFFPIRRIKKEKLYRKLNLKRNCHISTDIKVTHPKSLFIGEYVYIGPQAFIQSLGKVEIGRGTIIGPELRVYSANHRFKHAHAIPYDEVYEMKPVKIGENVWIGGNVIIVPGSEIGDGVIVGAGCVVSGKIPPFSIIIGNPCKIIGLRDKNNYDLLKSKDNIYLKLKIEGKFIR